MPNAVFCLYISNTIKKGWQRKNDKKDKIANKLLKNSPTAMNILQLIMLSNDGNVEVSAFYLN